MIFMYSHSNKSFRVRLFLYMIFKNEIWDLNSKKKLGFDSVSLGGDSVGIFYTLK